MEAIKRISQVVNHQIIIDLPLEFENKQVVVIISPVIDYNEENEFSDKNEYTLKGSVLEYRNPYEPVIGEADWEVLQ